MKWMDTTDGVNWEELSELYRIAPLGDKRAEDLKTTFSNSMFKYLVQDGGRLIAAGRALADGVDCSYLCDIVVHPDYQGRGIGKALVERLKALSAGHRKIILYANPGKEGFYRKLGFSPMQTAMAIFKDHDQAVMRGFIKET